ncbi:MAG: sulfite exporter TauE/SafE family protein [Burkholderiales bacterium]|nr:sulfite exporter TauE/SafE family protein [Burkholderiales bacterium]
MVALTVLCAYSVFGITGFGAAMVAVPVLAHLLPLSTVVPLILLTDLLATTFVGLRQWRLVQRSELVRLMLPMLVGVVLGVQALSELPSSILLLLLGLFIVGHSVWSLWIAQASHKAISPSWAYMAGTVGGVFGAAFGTGGPIYTVYLIRRIPEVEALRATVAATVLISALVRLVVFGVSGLLLEQQLHLLALGLIPFCLLGLVIGSKLRHQLPPQRLRRIMLQLLLVGGLSVIYRSQVV